MQKGPFLADLQMHCREIVLLVTDAWPGTNWQNTSSNTSEAVRRAACPIGTSLTFLSKGFAKAMKAL